MALLSVFLKIAALVDITEVAGAVFDSSFISLCILSAIDLIDISLSMIPCSCLSQECSLCAKVPK